jgi:hypothetical protein
VPFVHQGLEGCNIVVDGKTNLVVVNFGRAVGIA